MFETSNSSKYFIVLPDSEFYYDIPWRLLLLLEGPKILTDQNLKKPLHVSVRQNFETEKRTASQIDRLHGF